MSNVEHDRRIDYIEFSVPSIPEVKRFYGRALGWSFEDYGPDYTSFADGRLSGGFQTAKGAGGGPLVVIYAVDLEAMEQRIKGRRNHRAANLQLSRRASISLYRPGRPRAGGVV
jgi:uncharacterized protein